MELAHHPFVLGWKLELGFVMLSSGFRCRISGVGFVELSSVDLDEISKRLFVRSGTNLLRRLSLPILLAVLSPTARRRRNPDVTTFERPGNASGKTTLI